MKILLYIPIIIAIAMTSCTKAGKIDYRTEGISSGKILLDKKELYAGSKLDKVFVKISDTPLQDELTLVVNNKWGIKVLNPDFENENVLFDLSEIAFEERGDVELLLIANEKILDRYKFTILPLTGDSLIESYLGPKTIFVGAQEKSMLTNVITDKYGNPVQDGTPVDYNRLFPNSEKIEVRTFTDHLISYMQFSSKKKTGKIMLGASCGRAIMREQEVRVIPGAPVNIDIEVAEWFPYADNRQTVWLRTSVLVDAYNNVVADGTLINFLVESKAGYISEYKSYTVGGIANVYLENPAEETNWEIYAVSHGEKTSNTLSLDFSSNIERVSFDYNKIEHKVNVGPIISKLGQHIPDGTEIQLAISHGTHMLMLEQESLDGYCEFKLAGKRFRKGSYKLDLIIGGETSTKNLDIL